MGNVDPDVESTIAAEWTPLSGNGANTQTYRPQEGPAGDVDRHLLVRALYNDTEGAGKAAIGVSAHRVRADVSDEANASPDFESNETTRSVPEDTAVGSPVGSPVIVDVNEDNDILTYELVMDTGQNPAVVGGDLPFFSIDQASGQIKLEKKLSAEQTDGRDYTGEDPRVAGTYTVVVRATDPSGELALNDNRDDITVEVIATDVPEAPRVTEGNAEIEVDEMNSATECYVGLGNTKGADCEVTPNTENLYKKSDDDANDGVLRWELIGPDSGLFQFSTPGDGIGRRVHFIDAPDYEDPMDQGGDNVYNVTVVVMDTAGQAGQKALRIEVRNVDEAGDLELEPEQPRVGVPVNAALSDADGILVDAANDLQTVTKWQWYMTTADAEITLVDGDLPLNAAGLTEIKGATTSDYTPGDDDIGNFLYVRVQYRDGNNTEDDPTTSIVTADERDGRAPDVPVDGAAAVLANPDRILIGRTANAVQAAGSTVINGPVVNVAPEFDPTSVTFKVPENTSSTGYVGTPVVALDKGDTLVYDLSGVDARNFAFAERNSTYYAEGLERDTGPSQIAVKPVTHFDHEFGKTYILQLGATDSHGERTTAEVVVEITDVNEAPSEPVELLSDFAVSGLEDVIVAEGVTVVATYEAVRSPAGTTPSWSLSSSYGDAENFSISSSGELTFREAPDYENPADEDTDNVYEVEVKGSAGSALEAIKVIITVTNVDEVGTVTLDPDMPRVGMAVTAVLMDPDGLVDVVWEWTKSSDVPGFWPTIASSASPIYTPVEADLGRLLRASARYTDEHSSTSKTVRAITAQPVGAAAPPAPEFPSTEDGARSVAEDAVAGDLVGAPVVASDADSYDLGGADVASFAIDANTGQITVGADTTLDYESKDSYTVTVTASDTAGTSDEIMVIIAVTDVDEPGTVTLSPATAPRVGAVVTASLIDPDGDVTRIAWQWASSDVMGGTYRDIVGAISSAYTPVDADEGMYLKAMASYDDAWDTDKSAAAESANAVTATDTGDPLLVEYDPNNDGVIERTDMRRAVANYYGNSPTLTRAQMRQLVAIYYAN